jgi:hypothetical protein
MYRFLTKSVFPKPETVLCTIQINMLHVNLSNPPSSKLIAIDYYGLIITTSRYICFCPHNWKKQCTECLHLFLKLNNLQITRISCLLWCDWNSINLIFLILLLKCTHSGASNSMQIYQVSRRQSVFTTETITWMLCLKPSYKIMKQTKKVSLTLEEVLLYICYRGRIIPFNMYFSLVCT